MPVTFKSKDSASIMMDDAHAKEILDLLEKDVKRGVITAQESGSVIAILEAKSFDSKQHSVSVHVAHDVASHHNANGDDNGHEQPEGVSFANRVFPLLEMLRIAQQQNQYVIWDS